MRSLIATISVALASICTGVQAVPCQSARTGEEVVLSGFVARKLYPGPPLYESGSKMETVKVLRLKMPICALPDLPLSQKTTHFEQVQLSFSTINQSVLNRMRVGSCLSVKGFLFAAESGHHHTPLVLDVTEASNSGACR